MPSVAVWLLARPQNAVFAMVVAMLVPGLAMVSGAILLLVVLQQDLQKASMAAVLSGAVLVAVALGLGSAPLQAFFQVALLWVPILGLSAMMRSTRSLTLTLQLSVIMVVVGTCLFFVLVSDPIGFWQNVIAADPLLLSLTESLQQWKTAIGATDMQFAGVMTTMYAIGFWFGLVIVILLGYWLYLQLPDTSPQYGRFSDLNFGRVIALVLAITSVVGFLIDAVWVQSVAFFLFAVFWLQGAAMVHWLRSKGLAPVIAVSAVYVLTILLPQYVFPALAVLGYTDAWFEYRSRVTKQQ
ncbi:MAG: hypothetical protein ACR2QS_00865 [Woeseiaceae bacterium]